MNNIYKEDSIESLDPREHVRLRPGMYAGNTKNPNQLLMEIFSNALDEHNIGHGNFIVVNIDDNGTVNVEDHGQGFPINIVREEDNKTILEASFSVINTSGKFSDDGIYEGTSLGLNGIGGKLTNFLSEWFEVISYNNGQYEHLWFKDGIFQKRETGKWPKHKDSDYDHGTTVIYKPDPQFFESDKTDINFFENFFNDICCLCPNLTVRLNNKDISHPNGIEEILPRKIKDDVEIINNPFIMSAEQGKNKVDIAITFTSNSSSTIIPYVNYGYTTAGPHVTAIKSTVTRVFNSWAKENGLIKIGEKNLDGNSIQEGMVLVCNIIARDVAYDAQVKSNVTKIDTSFLTSTLGDELEVWLDNNPKDAEIIIEKALIARKAAEAARKARAAVKNKNEQKVKKVLNLPSKLADCYSNNRKDCEIYIVEGDSASGNLKTVRDNEFQAILPVRGKILNTQKATLEKIMKNAEIVDMIKAFGLKVSPDGKRVEYNKNNIRYGKIIIMSDAE